MCLEAVCGACAELSLFTGGGQVCVSCPCIGFAYCGWLGFGFVGCCLCQAAMITFPQWMAALGVLAFSAGFGSVLFYNPCTSSEP